MGVRILCIGDIHLGRSPSKLSNLDEGTASISASALLSLACEHAIAERVDAVFFTGDVVDQENAFYEAYGPLKLAVRSLLAEHIPVVAIAGNHDFDVLPRLAKEIPEFILLGADGAWQEITLRRKGTPVMTVRGRSFTAREFRGDPLQGYPDSSMHESAVNSQPSSLLPTVSLLHCDVDASESAYAPISLRQLSSTLTDAWLLGHIHKPQILAKQPLVLYPGSLLPLDPGEPGAHGPWIVTISESGSACASQVPLSPLRYESITVDLSKVSAITEFEHALLEALRAWNHENQNELTSVTLVVLRVQLVGRTHLSQNELQKKLLALRSQELWENRTFLLERFENHSRPAIDLERLALGFDPPALLAQRIQVLSTKQPANEYQSLLRNATSAARQQLGDSSFYGTSDQEPLVEETALRERLLRTAWHLLDSLLEQKEIAE